MNVPACRHGRAFARAGKGWVFNRCGALVISLFAFVAGAAAQPGSAARPTVDHLPVWKVEGITNSVYLIGSMHLLKDSHYPLPAVMETAFREAPVVVFETDMEALGQPEVSRRMTEKSILPEGETIKDRLSKETCAALMNYAERSGRLKDNAKEAFVRLKPIPAAVSLMNSTSAKLGLKAELGLDNYFYRRAKVGGKRIISLDPVDSVVGIWTEIPKEQEEVIVKAMLKDMDVVARNLGEIVKAWEGGDAKRLSSLMKQSMHDSPELRKRMLTDRNAEWLPKIQAMIRSGENITVIIGAGHLVGEGSLVELLEAQGHKLVQQRAHAASKKEFGD